MFISPRIIGMSIFAIISNGDNIVSIWVSINSIRIALIACFILYV